MDVDSSTRLECSSFNALFREFSTQHSWYKIGQELPFFFVPQDGEHPWTLQLSYGLDGTSLHKDVVAMIKEHPTPIGPWVYCRFGHPTLSLVLGNGGWPVLERWEELGHGKAAAQLRGHCIYDSAAHYPRHKIVYYDGQDDTKEGIVGDMIVAEYRRMRSAAKEQFYRLMSKLQPWILRHRDTPSDFAGDLFPLASRYVKEADTITANLHKLTTLPVELGHLCLLFHHSF